MSRSLLVSLVLCTAATVTGLNISTNGEPYVLSNLFDGVSRLLTWTDLRSNNFYASSDYPMTYMSAGTNVSTNSFWTFEENVNNTLHVYNSHYPNKDIRLDVGEFYIDKSETKTIPLPFFGKSNDSAGSYGQVWQVISWSDGSAKLFNPGWDLVLDIASSLQSQPPAMLAAGKDTSALGGQHWKVQDAHPLDVVTVVTYQTVTVTSPVVTQTVAAGGVATSVVSVYETVTVTQLATAAAAASSTTAASYSLSGTSSTVIQTSTSTVTVGGSTVYVADGGAAISETKVVTSATMSTITITALQMVVASTMNQTITATPSTQSQTSVTSSSTSQTSLSATVASTTATQSHTTAAATTTHTGGVVQVDVSSFAIVSCFLVTFVFSCF